MTHQPREHAVQCYLCRTGYYTYNVSGLCARHEKLQAELNEMHTALRAEKVSKRGILTP